VVTFDWQHDAPRYRDDPAWATFPEAEYTILVVARSLTSACRLLEAVAWFRDDFRIRLVFTVDATSAFSAGAPDMLRAAGVRLVEWEQVLSRSFHYHLALAASENLDFDAIDAHTILLPHGLGFNKLVPNGEGRERRVAGLPPTSALRAGKVTVALSHPEQRDQLLALNPDTAGRTAIVGDPTFDRLRASRGLRARYREALGTNDRTLVTIASTWGEQSLIGRRHTLPAQLLAAVEADSHQVALVLHPNVWSYYGAHQIELWLSSALDAGLLLMPADAGWQATLISSDLVVSDHGSLALFAAGLDRPLLLTGVAPETVAGTPTDQLARLAPTLRSGAAVRPQLRSALNRHRPGQYADVTDRVFAHVGHATRNIQKLIYRNLGVPPRDHPDPLTRIPVPRGQTRTITSYVVHTTSAKASTLILARFPASVRSCTEDDEYGDTHVVADESEPDPTVLERAAAITCDQPRDLAHARQRATDVLSTYPGARLAAVATLRGCLVVIRGGRSIQVVTDTPRIQLIASAVYCCLVDGSLSDRHLTIRAGKVAIEARFITDRSGDSATR
jgi:hypothetical protein